MFITAQVAYYPLGQADFRTIIGRLLDTLADPTVKVEYGTMSTTIFGDHTIVLGVIHRFVEIAFSSYPSILDVKISNACTTSP